MFLSGTVPNMCSFPLWIRSSHLMICYDMSWYIMINDMFCHEMSPNIIYHQMSPNIIICHEMSPCLIERHFMTFDDINLRGILMTFDDIWWFFMTFLKFFRVLPSRCHQMSWNVFQFNMVTFHVMTGHVMMWPIWFREVSTKVFPWQVYAFSLLVWNFD